MDCEETKKSGSAIKGLLYALLPRCESQKWTRLWLMRGDLIWTSSNQ